MTQKKQVLCGLKGIFLLFNCQTPGHLRYLKEYRRATYITLFTSGRLNNYLADIDRQAQERMERLTEQMKRVQGITEQLKAENALEWTQRMNNIRACAKEIVEKEIIFA